MSIDEDENVASRAQDERIVALHESIRRAFPAEPYSGKITSMDGDWPPELDDDEILYNALNGRRWTELPTHLLCAQPDGYELLTDNAFVAFLPAWLMYSLEDLTQENEVRDFIVYSFSNTMRKFRCLNSDQQRTVRSILLEFTERGTCALVRKLAAEAIALIDRRRY